METILHTYGLDNYVKNIYFFEEKVTDSHTVLPFYADGCPGIIYQTGGLNAIRLPDKKTLSTLFVYGQTIHPIELSFVGAYQMLVFQLYPFAARTFFGIHPKTLNDDCYDLAATGPAVVELLAALKASGNSDDYPVLMATFLAARLKTTSTSPQEQIRLALHLLLESGGQLSVSELCYKLHLTERTVQRLFEDQIGISPKQFAQIVQFDLSFQQVIASPAPRLTDIVFENGYADQSHFIRRFRKYTGHIPSRLMRKTDN
ncbi:helix-turn-helix domain-containing protein [Flavihumibacter petaseus]|uniref:Putative AraC family transcriptional regulator n=1 Tax=Flavihumibacter petaseus NBRC 106054 TaxID=1220578 RepID=A0A0E9MY04_9BACT|nr:AraC family transcriptional regulator [Flavihumibacter petaseus]GAO42612.1 putative AraC family transcriptional regulator [Flavihumibacter petaseus NBRC 106054]